MTKAEKIRQSLIDDGIVVLDCEELQRESIISPDGFIGLGKLANSAEEHSVLLHDAWHLRLGAFYTIHSPFCIRAQMEHRVNKRALMTSVPPEKLGRMLKTGAELWEIAEQLELPEEDVISAYLLYKDLGCFPYPEQNEVKKTTVSE